jgi:putative transposase
MATTFTKILVHFVFSTKNREALINPGVEASLHAYMTGIARNQGCWVLAMNGTEDHVHMLVSMDKKMTVVRLMEEMKGDSSRWMNEEHPQRELFRWQEGYAGFSIGESGVEA